MILMPVHLPAITSRTSKSYTDRYICLNVVVVRQACQTSHPHEVQIKQADVYIRRCNTIFVDLHKIYKYTFSSNYICR